MGVTLVVSFDETSSDCSKEDASRGHYEAAGLAYFTLDDLCGGAGPIMSLQSLDRFLSLVTRCPGLVAVQCRGGLASGVAATHLTALLLRQRCFSSAAEAVAWMQMAWPCASAEPVDLSLLERLSATPSGAGRFRARSLSICGDHGGKSRMPPSPGRAAGLALIVESAGPWPGPPLAPVAPSRPAHVGSGGGRGWAVFSASSPSLFSPGPEQGLE